MASVSPSQSEPLTVSYLCHCQLSGPIFPRLAAIPPWAATVWERVGKTLVTHAVHDPDLSRMSITVGEVRVTPDLKIATAYVLPLGGKGQDEVLGLLARNKNELRRAVGKELTLKYAPDLRFRLDETFDQMDETRRMFSEERVRRDVEGS